MYVTCDNQSLNRAALGLVHRVIDLFGVCLVVWLFGCLMGVQIYMKYSCPAYPSITRFYLSLFTDEYSCHLHSIYQIYVHSHMGTGFHDVTVGAAHLTKLTLPAVNSTRTVMLHSASPDLAIGTAQPFVIEPNRVNDVSLSYRTHSPGKKSFLLHLLDVSGTATNPSPAPKLLQSWLVSADAAYPAITQRYDVVLKANESIAMKIPYRNAMAIDKTYHIDSSVSERIKVRESRLTVPANSTAPIRILVCAPPNAGTQDVLLFVNDSNGQTLDVLLCTIHTNAK